MAIRRSENHMNSDNKFRNISVVGAGAWGTALAEVISRQGNQVNLWAKEQSVTKSINSNNENSMYLPDIKLSKLIIAFNNIEQITNCDFRFNCK